MFKRILALLMVFALLIGCASAETVTTEGTSDQKEFTYLPYHDTETITMGSTTYQIERKLYPYYRLSGQDQLAIDIPLYFVDGVDDLPYMDFVEFVFMLMHHTYKTLLKDSYSDFDVTFENFTDLYSDEIIIARDNGSRMIFNYHNGTLTWDDYDGFFLNNQGYYIDPLGGRKTDASGQPYLVQRIRSRERHGEHVVINLSDYGIPIIVPDGYNRLGMMYDGEKCLIPLQTLSSLCFFPLNMRIYFNGESLIFANVASMQEPFDWSDVIQIMLANGLLTEETLLEGLEKCNTYDDVTTFIISELVKTELGQMLYDQLVNVYQMSAYYIFFSGQTGERSPELAQYGYNELCLEMDSFYGLKEIHNIDKFDSFFSQTGLKEDLLSTDAQRADAALSELVYYWLDDGHSGLISPSYIADSSGSETALGQGIMSLIDLQQQLNLVRAKHPESLEPYYEVGNTAYVTFDEFDVDTSLDYYSLLQTGELPDDTIGLIVKAHQQITREGSTIENVVLDLSNNGGGKVVAAAFVMGWFLGEADISVANMFSGAQSTATYQADVNLDHKFDESDTVSHLKLYCLISPFSFSCGNLVPWEFKTDGRVTLLGRTSGGGSCLVGYTNTAWGASFRFSSPMRLSFVKNGSFYDIDQGVTPDYFINSYDNFYDREALTEYINNLY